MKMRHVIHEASGGCTAQVTRNLHLYRPEHSFYPTYVPLKPCPNFSQGATRIFPFLVLALLYTNLINLFLLPELFCGDLS